MGVEALALGGATRKGNLGHLTGLGVARCGGASRLRGQAADAAAGRGTATPHRIVALGIVAPAALRELGVQGVGTVRVLTPPLHEQAEIVLGHVKLSGMLFGVWLFAGGGGAESGFGGRWRGCCGLWQLLRRRRTTGEPFVLEAIPRQRTNSER